MHKEILTFYLVQLLATAPGQVENASPRENQTGLILTDIWSEFVDTEFQRSYPVCKSYVKCYVWKDNTKTIGRKDLYKVVCIICEENRW